MSKKRAHKTLSLEEKLTILDELSSKTHRQLAEKDGVGVSTVIIMIFIIIIMIFITSIIRTFHKEDETTTSRCINEEH